MVRRSSIDATLRESSESIATFDFSSGCSRLHGPHRTRVGRLKLAMEPARLFATPAIFCMDAPVTTAMTLDITQLFRVLRDSVDELCIRNIGRKIWSTTARKWS